MVKIFELFGKKSVLAVMSYFLEHPLAEIHAQPLIKRLKLSRKPTFDALRLLEKGGLISSREIGRAKMYTLRRENAAVKQLKILATLDIIIPLLSGLEGSEAYLFGSCARGEDTEASDIDILIIGETGGSDALGRIKPHARMKPIYMSPIGYAALARKDPAFYERLEKDRIRVV
jgi:predicted nucleotidyltransferase